MRRGESSRQREQSWVRLQREKKTGVSGTKKRLVRLEHSVMRGEVVQNKSEEIRELKSKSDYADCNNNVIKKKSILFVTDFNN